jgi:membrane-associated phospholipid phosphatase
VFSCVALIACTRTAGAQRALISGRDMALVAGATAGAAVLSRYDVPIARMFTDSAFHGRHPGLTTAANRASMATETVYMIGGGAVWGLARLRKNDGTADVALHTTESVVSAAMFIQIVRGALGRARPYVIDNDGEKRDADPYDFEYFHGFTSFNYRSFPSMHAMASFAVATALTQEMRVRNSPNRGVISPLLYAGAAAPALARMYLDEHWASDIALGAFLGVFAGQKAVLYSHAHPNNRIDREFLRPSVSATVRFDARGLSLMMLPF